MGQGPHSTATALAAPGPATTSSAVGVVFAYGGAAVLGGGAMSTARCPLRWWARRVRWPGYDLRGVRGRWAWVLQCGLHCWARYALGVGQVCAGHMGTPPPGLLGSGVVCARDGLQKGAWAITGLGRELINESWVSGGAPMSAFGGRADVNHWAVKCLLIAISGHSATSVRSPKSPKVSCTEYPL